MPNIPSIPSIPSMPKGLPSIPTKADFMGPDEEIVVFEDIKPATKHHFLVVTNEHIRDAKAMVSSQIRILDRMIEVANQVLAEKLNQDAGIGDPTQVQRLLGFHWPPFHMVNHLHLHVLAPADQMGFFARLFKHNLIKCSTLPDYVRDRLMQMKSTEEAGAGNAINSQPDQ
ncbi:Histidine triad nucleotide-binding protein 3 [Folsomia candida]|uniref:Histidine triad nucleotide-binding protein 3 n=1 Tax=Folsomia candida TaxID=158441 RepID=A0A226EW95_FOLCA|nr:Histidine triad nucleotide-binding protein 3 [Folsomia candida]